MYSMVQPKSKKVSAPTPQQVAQVQNVAKQVVADIKTVKAGYRTTEFWIHLVLQVLVWGVALTSNDPSIQIAGISVSAVLGTVYTLARTYLKGL
jgi:hypothetical protein